MRYLLPFVIPTIAFSQDISLSFPVDCKLGTDCYLQQFVDHDPTAGTRDFACGNLTYDTHKGTDIALPSLAAQAAGVDVLAAAPGRVLGIRDGLPDILQGQPNAPDIADRACGNGVVIDHGDGWQTQYCHLAKGSITVGTGQNVARGSPLGQIGLSGKTQFPHLHLTLRRNGQTVDPFAPDGQIDCAVSDPETLWINPPATPPGGIISSGFSSSVPDYAAIKAGTAHRADLQNDDPALVVWAFVFGGRKNDEIRLTINGPAGIVHSHTVQLSRTQAQLFRASGRRTPEQGWPAGDYTGTITLLRDDRPLDTRTTSVTISR